MRISNINSDITFRENISIYDLYINQYIQVCGNINCIYKITKINLTESTINISSTHIIMGRYNGYNAVGGASSKDVGSFKLEKISESKYIIEVDVIIDTIYSARLNRLNKLDELLGNEK